MRRRMQTHLVAVITLGCTLIGFSTVAAETVHWETDLQAALAQAKAEDRPVLMHFWTPSCVPCRQLEKTVFNRPRVISSLERHFIPVKINAHEHPQLASRYGIRSVPKDVIVMPDEEEVHRMFTPKDPDQYVAQLSAIAFRIDRQTDRSGSSSRTAEARRDGAYQSGPSAYDQKPLAMSSDPSRTARRSPLSTQPDPAPRELLAAESNTRDDAMDQAASETGPREIINRFAGKAQHDQATRHGGRSFQDDRTRPSPSRWGSWPNSATSSSGRSGTSPPPRSSQTVAEAEPPADRSGPSTGTRASQGTAVTNGFAGRSDRARQASQRSPGTRPANAPPLGMDGYCPVTLLQENRWVRGDKRYGVIHRGRTYLFAGPQQKEKFFADPDEYSPVLAGIDPVALTNQGEAVEGKRVHGVVYHRRVYLFSSEDNLKRFWQNPERFASPIRQAMETGDLNRLLR